jgi:hypothetical protein
MGRSGVVVLSADCGAKAVLDDLLEDVVVDDSGVLLVCHARTCIAVMNSSLRRRLLVVDGAPDDLSAGGLIEAVHMTDPELPIVLVLDGASGPKVHNRVRIVPGPLVSIAATTAILQALGGQS